jgi:hypothetical protein
MFQTWRGIDEFKRHPFLFGLDLDFPEGYPSSGLTEKSSKEDGDIVSGVIRIHTGGFVPGAIQSGSTAEDVMAEGARSQTGRALFDNAQRIGKAVRPTALRSKGGEDTINRFCATP